MTLLATSEDTEKFNAAIQALLRAVEINPQILQFSDDARAIGAA